MTLTSARRPGTTREPISKRFLTVPTLSESLAGRGRVDRALAVLGRRARGRSNPVAGSLLETFVINELTKLRATADIDVGMFHFQDRDGREVDCVLEHRVVEWSAWRSKPPRPYAARTSGTVLVGLAVDELVHTLV